MRQVFFILIFIMCCFRPALDLQKDVRWERGLVRCGGNHKHQGLQRGGQTCQQFIQQRICSVYGGKRYFFVCVYCLLVQLIFITFLNIGVFVLLLAPAPANISCTYSCTAHNLTLNGWYLRCSSPKNEDSVTIYSPSSCTKPVWVFASVEHERLYFVECW